MFTAPPTLTNVTSFGKTQLMEGQNDQALIRHCTYYPASDQTLETFSSLSAQFINNL